MKRSNALHRSRIDWETIKEPDFNRVIEALLRRLYDRLPFTVDVVRGAGGDKGIDVVVWNENHQAEKIFQLKHFLGGASGAFVGRREQIKKSFNRAWDNYSPKAWVLVMPPNGRIEELEYIHRLAEDKDVAVAIWGQAVFDDKLSEHQDIERACLRNELEEVLTGMALEKAALVGGEDLSQRVVALSEIVEGRSLYWTTNFSMQDGEYIETYTPKHPDAMKVEPIHTQVSLTFGDSDQEIADRVKDTLDWGSFDPTDIPGRAATFYRKGPSWVQPVPPKATGTLSMVAPTLTVDPKETVTLNFIDEAGYSQGRFDGKVHKRSMGRVGTSLKMRFASMVDITIRSPHDRTSTVGGLQISFSVIGALVSDAARALKLEANMRPGGILEIFHNGHRTQKVQLDSNVSGMLVRDPYTEELIDDLLALQERLETSFTVPEEMTPRERVMIRVGRLMLDGFLTVMPPGTDLTATLSGEYDERLVQFIREGGTFTSRPDAFALDIQGSKYNLGPATLFHRNLRVVDASEVIASLESGSGEPIPIRMRPEGPEPIQVWLGVDTHFIPEFRPWNLSNFEPAPNSGENAEVPEKSELNEG